MMGHGDLDTCLHRESSEREMTYLAAWDLFVMELDKVSTALPRRTQMPVDILLFL